MFKGKRHNSRFKHRFSTSESYDQNSRMVKHLFKSRSVLLAYIVLAIITAWPGVKRVEAPRQWPAIIKSLLLYSHIKKWSLSPKLIKSKMAPLPKTIFGPF